MWGEFHILTRGTSEAWAHLKLCGDEGGQHEGHDHQSPHHRQRLAPPAGANANAGAGTARAAATAATAGGSALDLPPPRVKQREARCEEHEHELDGGRWTVDSGW